MSFDGIFYVTFPKLGTTNGGVFVTDRLGTNLTNITPRDLLVVGYGALAVDPTPGSGTVLVGQADDQFTYRLHAWRTTDRGSTWTQPNSIIDSDNATIRASGDTYLGIGQFGVNPFNPVEVFGGDAFGAFRTPNIASPTQHWSFVYKGHEELLPYDIKSPPVGAPLLSGWVDFPGGRHMNVTQYTNGFTYSSSPMSFGDGPSLDFCESNPNIWARIVHSFGFGALGYTSSDNGATWTSFGSSPNINGGRIAVSGGNCRNFVWLSEIGTVYYTLNGGATWTAAVNAPTIGLGQYSFNLNPLAADRVSANTFYLVDIDATGNARTWRSTNGGANWTVMGTIPPLGGAAYNYRIIADPTVAGKLWLDLNNLDGVWKSTNGGATYTRVGQLQGTGMISFGKAATGRTNPAVLFYGSLDGVSARGVYVSPDDGVTWQAFPTFAIPDVFDGPIAFGGDRQTYGRAYIGTSGRGLFVGDLVP